MVSNKNVANPSALLLIVDLVLEGEGQQYGNMEEAASVARTPASCLEVWSGGHRQTPGGLKKNKESKALQEAHPSPPCYEKSNSIHSSHDLGGIAQRYLDCPENTFPWKLHQLLEDSTFFFAPVLRFFFCSLLLQCDLLAKKVPGRAPYSQHIMIRNWT